MPGAWGATGAGGPALALCLLDFGPMLLLFSNNDGRSYEDRCGNWRAESWLISFATGRSKEDQTKSWFSLKPGDEAYGWIQACAEQSGKLGRRNPAALTEWEEWETGIFLMHSLNKHPLNACRVNKYGGGGNRNSLRDHGTTAYRGSN